MLESFHMTMNYKSVFFRTLSGLVACASTGQYARRSRCTVLARMDDSPFILYLLPMTQIVTYYSILHKLSDYLFVRSLCL